MLSVGARKIQRGQMSGKIDSPIYPVLSWRIAVGSAAVDRVTFLEIGYATNLTETRDALTGRPPAHSIPLGMTSRQCRDLAADLIDAANNIEGESARQ
jgi:hypothetical protein